VIRPASPTETQTLSHSVQCALHSGPDGDWIDTVLLPAVAEKAARRAEGLRVKEAARKERAARKQEERRRKAPYQMEEAPAGPES
jgi:hypothetical protein